MKRFRVKAYLLLTLLLGVFLLPGCGSDAGNGHWVAPPVNPTVSSTVPANTATLVAVGNNITATFSQPMAMATINTTTFKLMDGVTPINGAVSYVGVTAVFNPTNPLDGDTLYTATITTGATNVAGYALASNYVWTFRTGIASDTTPPSLTSTIPVDGAIDVATNSAIIATFSEAMDPESFNNTTTFSLKETLSPFTSVGGSVVVVGATATFIPTLALAPLTSYTATVTTAAQDLATFPLDVETSWSFTTLAAPDTTPPTVLTVFPVDGAINVPINSNVTATFSEAMKSLTISTDTFTVVERLIPANTVLGAVALVGNKAIFNPLSDLKPNTEYTATVTSVVQDAADLHLLNDKIWNFKTSAIAQPEITSTTPIDQATNVSININAITATFNMEMNQTTLDDTTFTVQKSGPPLDPVLVSGIVSYDALTSTVTFVPTSPLEFNTNYTVTVTDGAKNLAGTTLIVPVVDPDMVANPWTFTTEVEVVLPLGPALVDLKTAGNFVILTKSGITTTGVTKVTGDMGASPITSTGIEGFDLILDIATGQFSTSSLVTGKIYAPDYSAPTPVNMTTAISDMETAYTDAAGRTLPDGTELYAGNLSGQTFTAGLYKWSTGISVDAGSAVTLTGGANDVWIFQIDGDITMNPGAAVTLLGDAQAKNIFWQVGGGTGVLFDTSVAFQGNVLAAKAIVFNAGATLNGRALAQTNVTLISSTVTAP